MRYLPLTDTDREDMLARIGVSDVDALFSDVPAGKLLKAPVDLPRAKGELREQIVMDAIAANRNLLRLAFRALIAAFFLRTFS